MRIVADLHLHSHYSISTSPDLDLEHLALWAGRKGIGLVGTGDFTHPAWREELGRKLVPAEAGLYALAGAGDEQGGKVRFVPSAEISSIYRFDGKVRKVHNVILAPSLDVAGRISAALSRIGNLASDGRPILALDSRDLLEIVLDSSPDAFLIPAHIWTPWFSALGSRSGFDSLAACYRDLAPHIRAVETGLSSDPPMNWMCSALDGYTLVSNSDAHSPEKLGREANLLDIDLSYPALLGALRGGVAAGLRGTVEFFPEEGKYHFDGHRKCGVCQDPARTRVAGSLCPVCGRELTVGVLHRVLELADQPDGRRPPGVADYTPLVPLKELVAEVSGRGVSTKGVRQTYDTLLARCGSELGILLDLPVPEIERHGGDLLAEAVRRVRAGQVVTEPGYDGEYGKVHVFRPGEVGERFQGFLIPDGPRASPTAAGPAPRRPSAARGPDTQPHLGEEMSRAAAVAGLTDEQRSAAGHGAGPAMVIAGPGTGKTRTLAHRVAHLVSTLGVAPQTVLVVTFTNRAAGELVSRLDALLGPVVARAVRAGTFHAFGLSLLAASPGVWGRRPGFTLAGETERLEILARLVGDAQATAAAAQIEALKTGRVEPGVDTRALLDGYDAELRRRNVFDLDDLIRLPADAAGDLDPRVEWLLVDEIQDINPAQARLIRSLAPPPDGNLYVIGDPRQAIYGFRGSDPRLAQDLLAEYPGAATYTLGKSHRCPDNVLRAACGVLAGEGPTLPGSDRVGPKVRLVTAQSDRAEAEMIAREIERMMGGLRFFSMDSDIATGEAGEDVRGLGDFAVLVRMTRMAEPILAALDDHGIPYQHVGDRSPLEREPCRSLLAGLEAEASSGEGGLPLEARIREAAGRAGAPGPEMDEAVELLCHLAAPFGDDRVAFLRLVRLGSPGEDVRPGAEKVVVSTLHASKGLEFRCVFIAGCEEGLLPLDLGAFGLSSDPGEERRLLYVGMTRSSHLVVLSHAEHRRLFGRTLRLPLSRFLDHRDPERFETHAALPTRRPREQMELDLGVAARGSAGRGGGTQGKTRGLRRRT